MSAERFDGVALGVRIKLLRELRGMTLQQVSDASGITKSHVWELEQGRSQNPTVNAVWGLSAALCVSPANLLGLNDKMPPIEPVALKIAGIVDREIKRAIAALAPPAVSGLQDSQGSGSGASAARQPAGAPTGLSPQAVSGKAAHQAQERDL